MSGKRVLVINGPNINLIGTREKEVYGSVSYEELCTRMQKTAADLGLGLEIFQSNHEGALVDKIQSARGKADLIIINPGAFTHTSIAIRDALLGVSIPFIEVHISNIYRREEFRRKSYLSDIAAGVLAGFGLQGYFFALESAERVLSEMDDMDARR